MELKMIDITKLDPNPLQPRESFDREKLKELAGTISEVGILQPIFVRPKGDRYEIIGGERRYKASQIAGEKTIPALVKDLPDSEVMVQSLIENVHRENLKPVEQAKAILEVFKAEEGKSYRHFVDDKLRLTNNYDYLLFKECCKITAVIPRRHAQPYNAQRKAIIPLMPKPVGGIQRYYVCRKLISPQYIHKLKYYNIASMVVLFSESPI